MSCVFNKARASRRRREASQPGWVCGAFPRFIGALGAQYQGLDQKVIEWADHWSKPLESDEICLTWQKVYMVMPLRESPPPLPFFSRMGVFRSRLRPQGLGRDASAPRLAGSQLHPPGWALLERKREARSGVGGEM